MLGYSKFRGTSLMTHETLSRRPHTLHTYIWRPLSPNSTTPILTLRVLGWSEGVEECPVGFAGSSHRSWANSIGRLNVLATVIMTVHLQPPMEFALLIWLFSSKLGLG